MQAGIVVDCACVRAWVLTASPVFRQISDRPHNMNVTDGDSVTINCSAYAEPEAHVQWFQNGEELDRKCISHAGRWSVIVM